MTFEIALTGDSIINRAISFIEDKSFLEVIETIRRADVSLTHLEALLHDFDEPGVYPSAVAPRTFVRAPKSVAEELQWAGFDVVTHASNHALDYSYGGLRETWKALDEAGLPYAGTGKNLQKAREPTFVDTPQARVAVVSMTSTFSAWTRAGKTRGDVPGRPGVNPLRYNYEVDAEMLEMLREIGVSLGIGVNEQDDGGISLNWDSSHYSSVQFSESDSGETGKVLHPGDREENLRAIGSAANSADVVIAHLHTHEWKAGGTITEPPKFVEQFSRECIDAGANIVLNQGTHSPSRGIELYENSPIFYDPGDFFLMSDTVYNQPADFYYSHEDVLDVHPLEASPGNSPGQGSYRPWEDGDIQPENRRVSPKGGTFNAPGSILPLCRFDDGWNVESVKFFPITWKSSPRSVSGVPVIADGERASRIINHIESTSAEYGTDLTVGDGSVEIVID